MGEVKARGRAGHSPLPRRANAALARAAGLSLVEALAAMFVLAVGAVGVAGLQGAALAANRAALHRSEAVYAAVDLLERARANPAASYAVALGAAPPAFRDCIAASCSPAQLAAFDLATWKCGLGASQGSAACVAAQTAMAGFAPAQPGLPQGDGGVSVGADGVLAITVQWRAPGAAAPVRITFRGAL